MHSLADCWTGIVHVIGIDDSVVFSCRSLTSIDKVVHVTMTTVTYMIKEKHRAPARGAHGIYKPRFYRCARRTMEVDFDHCLWDLDRKRRRGARRAARHRASAGAATRAGADA